VSAGRGPYVGLITDPETSHRVWWVSMDVIVNLDYDDDDDDDNEALAH
jgi:hypothetical protein